MASLVVVAAAGLVIPGQALATALVRFVHAVPGVGKATITVQEGTKTTDIGSIGFAQASPWRAIGSGTFRWTLTVAGKTAAHGTQKIGDGAYDIVVELRAMQVWLGVYKAQGGRPGTSLVRVIHAAPELGSPDLTVDGKTVASRLAYLKATPYMSLKPGTHSLAAMAPDTGMALLSVPSAIFAAGVSYSDIVVGTRGQMIRLVDLKDRNGPPPAKPTSVTPTPGVKPKSAGTPAVRPAKPATPPAKRDKRPASKVKPPTTATPATPGVSGNGNQATTTTPATPTPTPGAAGGTPSASTAAAARPAPSSSVVVVQPGDSLWSIAHHALGANASNTTIYNEVLTIWRQNASRIWSGNPNEIYPGMRLQVTIP